MDANGFLVVKSELDDEAAYNAELYTLEQLKAARENPTGSTIDGGLQGEGGFPGGIPPRGRRGGADGS
jgi:hypothetical protein